MTNTIGNSYVIKTADGKILVMDGGVYEETPYLRGFLGALGNKVDCWFVSHPHDDHVGALTLILEDPQGIEIKEVCQSRFTEALLDTEPAYKGYAVRYYDALDKSGIKTIEGEIGMTMKFGDTNVKVLGVKNEDILTDYNNSSMVVKVWDDHKSVLFLGDLGAPSGEKLLNGECRKDLDCDYIQVAHHGQNGVTMDFYRTVKFKACLWPTPSWVYNNDIGGGFNTHTLKTMETRKTMEELGIKEHYLRFEGLATIK
jgi:beta-lactamase superfamily II metal-dependent hydrolase